MKKQIEEDTIGWKNIPCSWIGRNNIIKVTMLPKAIYRFRAIAINIPIRSSEKEKNNLLNVHVKVHNILNS
jgi:hypothetical protein